MTAHATATPRVGLVYPPFGPAALPSLGLAILSQRLMAAGYPTSTHYWNLDVLAALPLPTSVQRLAAYRSLTERTWFPFNEWIFGAELHGPAMAGRDLETELELLNRAVGLGQEILSADVLLGLRASAGDLVSAMVDRLVDADVVGIATTFFQNIPALALAKAIKERRPETRVVLGGANCDGEMGPNLFRHFGFLDAVFVGEADLSLVQYLDAIKSGAANIDIAGVLARGAAVDCVDCVASEPLRNLDVLDPPDFSGWLAERHRVGLVEASPTVIALEASRGCWWGAKHHCTFCGLNANGMAYRRKSPARFAAEVRVALAATDARFAYMTDNILPMDYLSAFAGSDRFGAPGVEFFFEVKANLRRDQIQVLAENGVTAVQPGVESLSSDLLRLMRKGVTAGQNVEFIRNAQDIGVRPVYNLLYGFPGEQANWYEAMIAQFPRLVHLEPPAAVAQVEYHRFSPYHDDPEDFGLRLKPLPAYRALYPLPTPEIARLAYMFTDDTNGPEQVFARISSYATRLQEGVFAWRRAYREQPLLLALDQGAEIVLWDTRPGYGPRFIHLRNVAAQVYRRLAVPATTAALARFVAAAEQHDRLHDQEFERATEDGCEVIILDLDPEEFLVDPDGLLERFDKLGLVFGDHEEPVRAHQGDSRSVSGHCVPVSRWVSLALSFDHVAIHDHWAEAGV